MHRRAGDHRGPEHVDEVRRQPLKRLDQRLQPFGRFWRHIGGQVELDRIVCRATGDGPRPAVRHVPSSVASVSVHACSARPRQSLTILYEKCKRGWTKRIKIGNLAWKRGEGGLLRAGENDMSMASYDRPAAFRIGRVFGDTFSVLGRNLGLCIGLAVIFSGIPSFLYQLWTQGQVEATTSRRQKAAYRRHVRSDRPSAPASAHSSSIWCSPLSSRQPWCGPRSRT